MTVSQSQPRSTARLARMRSCRQTQMQSMQGMPSRQSALSSQAATASRTLPTDTRKDLGMTSLPSVELKIRRFGHRAVKLSK